MRDFTANDYICLFCSRHGQADLNTSPFRTLSEIRKAARHQIKPETYQRDLRCLLKKHPSYFEI